jgi:hypothetical protein
LRLFVASGLLSFLGTSRIGNRSTFVARGIAIQKNGAPLSEAPQINSLLHQTYQRDLKFNRE